MQGQEKNQIQLTKADLKSIEEFCNAQDSFKFHEEKFSKAKTRFTEEMNELFSRKGIKKSFEVFRKIKSPESLSKDLEERITVTKVQKSTINFDVDALKKSLGKETFEKVTIKKYEILDMPGLTKYLKSCGVNPKIFKDFINVKISVDSKAINQLADLGEIEKEQLSGTYKIENSNPYYLVKRK